MNSGCTVFSQIMAMLPIKQFHRCVERYDGERKEKSFSCMDQFLTLGKTDAFAILRRIGRWMAGKRGAGVVSDKLGGGPDAAALFCLAAGIVV